MNEKIEKSTYTVTEISKILSISRNKGYELVKNDPPFKVIHIGKSFRVLKTDFDRWLYEGCVSKTA